MKATNHARMMMVFHKHSYKTRKQSIIEGCKTNPSLVLHAGPEMRYMESCKIFLAYKIQDIFKRRKQMIPRHVYEAIGRQTVWNIMRRRSKQLNSTL